MRVKSVAPTAAVLPFRLSITRYKFTVRGKNSYSTVEESAGAHQGKVALYTCVSATGTNWQIRPQMVIMSTTAQRTTINSLEPAGTVMYHAHYAHADRES